MNCALGLLLMQLSLMLLHLPYYVQAGGAIMVCQRTFTAAAPDAAGDEDETTAANMAPSPVCGTERFVRM